jgi:hypothetical protein
MKSARRGPHCDRHIINPQPGKPGGDCLRRKGLATVTDKYGAIARNGRGRPYLFCPLHLEQGTRQVNLWAKPAPVERKPTTFDLVLKIADLPIQITHDFGPFGGYPIRDRQLQRWYLWLTLYIPGGMVLVLALKQHFQ